GRLAVAASLSWGLVWVAVARLTGPPFSVATGSAAIAAVAAVVLVTVIWRVRSVRDSGRSPEPEIA
ncbi:MAG TPA: tryptophan-rich sensory protein, partial [Terrimesophilobacter sp.]|nr:tryptophan-rich sensory protein [Terrimesophilobacter sp.]